MKKIYLLFIYCISVLGIQAQETTESFVFNNETRTYLKYIPTSYSATTDTLPMVIALHGLGDTKENFNSFNGLKALAETEKFILITPQAETPTESVSIPGVPTPIQASTVFQNAWHSGAGGSQVEFGGQSITLPTPYYVSQSRDDVGFISALIDTISAQYNVNGNRVYATGFSMGGFMSNRLACELSSKIAAIASVSGTIGNEIKNSCSPDAIVPALHIHSTNDETVLYTNNNWGTDAEETISFWVNNNNCNTTPDTTDLSQVANDNFVSKKLLYNQGNANSDVEFFHLEGPTHNESWFGGYNDFSAASVIWTFFNKHKKVLTSIEDKGIKDNLDYSIYPNPARDNINISFSNKVELSSIAISNTLGKTIATKNFSKPIESASFDLKEQSAGIYFIRLNDKEGKLLTVTRFYKK